jgi:hypothetical protein
MTDAAGVHGGVHLGADPGVARLPEDPEGVCEAAGNSAESVVRTSVRSIDADGKALESREGKLVE